LGRACDDCDVTRFKSCGITNLDDAERAADLGAWAVGLILWPGSPRACKPAAAEQIGAALHRRCEVAGVFVNATLDDVALAADRYGLSLLQFHGDEGPIYCREAARRTGCKVMKAVRVKDAASVRGIEAFGTDYHLLDACVPGARGGTGRTFEWDLLRHHRGSVPVVLSGGLTADNVGEAIAATHPFAVDSASGTEASPGRKDPAKLEAFVRAVALADERQAVTA
jgi:phosphoribosylanthranilate isomerase